jgi:hypothetical protein
MIYVGMAEPNIPTDGMIPYTQHTLPGLFRYLVINLLDVSGAEK